MSEQWFCDLSTGNIKLSTNETVAAMVSVTT